MADVTATRASGGSAPVLPSSSPEALGLSSDRIELLYQLIESSIAAGDFPGAQIAIARHGRLAAFKSFGQAKVDPTSVQATNDTLWLLYSQTKPVTTAVIWQLVERGQLSFGDRIADYIPEFAQHSKGEITLFQVLTHQGGFPNSKVTPEAWSDHQELRRQVCNFTLEWTPGTQLFYHGESAHWTAAVLIEAITGRDFRDVIRTQLLDPLGIADIHVGVPDAHQNRCADMHLLEGDRQVCIAESSTAAFRAAGRPGGGGFATAAALTAFYQMILAGGTLNGVRVLSPRMIQYATRNHTDEKVDGNQGIAMHRGIGPYLRGTTSLGPSLGTLATPSTFGHGGAGSSFTFADPESGLSFTYLQNSRRENAWIKRHMDRVANIVHSALIEV